MTRLPPAHTGSQDRQRELGLGDRDKEVCSETSLSTSGLMFAVGQWGTRQGREPNCDGLQVGGGWVGRGFWKRVRSMLRGAGFQEEGVWLLGGAGLQKEGMGLQGAGQTDLPDGHL